MKHHTSINLAIATLFGIAYVAASGQALAYDMRDNAITHTRKAQDLMEHYQYVEAIEELKAAIQLNPYAAMTGSIYNNLGLAYRALKNYPYAFASFQRACRIQPTFSLYYKNLIETYAAAGLLAQAEKQLNSVVRSNPDDAEAWFMLGLLYKEKGSRKEAKSCFERFLILEPESEMAQAAKSAL